MKFFRRKYLKIDDWRLNYKLLWEALKEFNGDREIKSLFPEGHIGRNAEYKTIKEFMNSLEKLSKNRLAKALKHHRQWSGEDNG